MDSESESTKSHTESEEDDMGCYFLQPSSAPYNITEKVQQANMDLFTSQKKENIEKTAKVKFREELISFEPDLTDDDVNSIESDHTDVSIDAPRSPILEYKTTINNESLTIYNIEEDVEELEEEVLEEVESDTECKTEYKPEVKINTSVEKKINNNDEKATVSSRKVSSSSRRKKMSKGMAAFLNPREVICKEHCIDKLDRDLSMSIQKLDIQDKPILPPLQLLQRKCCDEVKKKIPQNLPHYDGLRSEYGLSSRQLEKREKQKELLRIREQMRQQLIEEYKRRKIQQNEEVFRQWLREVSKRSEKKNVKRRATSAKQSNSATTKTENKKTVDRPKTANAFIPRTKTRKKPKSLPANARIFIEVPSKCLEKPIRIGDLTIKNSKLFSRNIHIIAIKAIS